MGYKSIKNHLVISLVSCLILCSCGAADERETKQKNSAAVTDSELTDSAQSPDKTARLKSHTKHYAGLNWVDMSNPSDSSMFIAKHIVVCKMPTESDPTLALEAYETEGVDEPFLKITGSMEEGVILASIGDGKIYEATGPFSDDSEKEPFIYLSGKPADGSTADKPLDFIGSFKCSK